MTAEPEDLAREIIADAGLVGSGYDAIGWVAEGQRAGQMSYQTATKSAPYVTLGEEDAATFEAINAAVGFEDIQATMAMRLLQKTMLKEEMAILAGNNSLALGAPAAPTLAAAGSGATLPAATYSVIVVALILGVISVGSASPVSVDELEEMLTPAEMQGLRSFINDLMVEVGLAPGETPPAEEGASPSTATSTTSSAPSSPEPAPPTGS